MIPIRAGLITHLCLILALSRISLQYMDMLIKYILDSKYNLLVYINMNKLEQI